MSRFQFTGLRSVLKFLAMESIGLTRPIYRIAGSLSPIYSDFATPLVLLETQQLPSAFQSRLRDQVYLLYITYSSKAI
jgi:hypothetical protein